MTKVKTGDTWIDLPLFHAGETEPGAPDAGRARLYVFDNDGTLQLKVHRAGEAQPDVLAGE